MSIVLPKVLILFAALAICEASLDGNCGANDGSCPEKATDVVLLQRQISIAALDANATAGSNGSHRFPALAYDFGSDECRCVAVSGKLGYVNASTNESYTTPYPADLGSRCEEWDDGLHPECQGAGSPSWCTKKWCYVDPLDCDVNFPPKTSGYQPTATYQGRPIYFSYETCGAADRYTANFYENACVNMNTEQDCLSVTNGEGRHKCAWDVVKCLGKELVAQARGSLLDDSIIGVEACRCIGVSNSSGELVGTYPFGSKTIGAIYPSGVGSSCGAWDYNSHPDCAITGGVKPDWCSQKWCYVDTGSCDLDSPPARSVALAGASYQGLPMYFSYATCGGTDTYTASLTKTLTLLESASQISSAVKDSIGSYGKATCACVAVSGKLGYVNVSTGESQTRLYPADLGSRCEAWDRALHPDCQDAGSPSWCSEEWCYVDPFNCNSLAPPTKSSYQPTATYQGRPLYYSYDTCYGKDTYTAEIEEPSCANQVSLEACANMTTCTWTGEKCMKTSVVEEGVSTLGAAVIGAEACRCVGVSNSSGTLVGTYTFGSKAIGAMYPSGVGSSCDAWDYTSHPDCAISGGVKPDWCSQKWCYVDPCSCDLNSPPVTSAMLVGASYQGKPMYYSYATCGGTDTYTASEYGTACVNQMSKESCTVQDKCAWTGEKCLGTELVTVCEKGNAESAQLMWPVFVSMLACAFLL